ncbi:MAG: hypothetical protein LBL45_03845 [Treponema sp.]|jgi:hypothetical protein|nr:hypothetical protein [Treponema sp.]
MKKLPTGIFLCAVLAASSLSAQTTWTTNGVFSGKQAVSASLAMYSAPLIEKGQFPLSARYRFEIPQVSAMGAFQFSEDTQDIVLNGVYFPLNTPRFRVGAGASYHGGWFEMDGDLASFQSDIFLGAYATINFWRMYLNIHVGWFEQIITVPALSAEYDTFAQSDMAASLFIGGKLLDNFSAELGVSSYELYRYHLFFTPAFSLALRYEFQTPRFQDKALEGRIFAELSTSVRYSDMFTLSGHVEYSATTITIGYTF